ncbi:MAG: hypothetical protein M1337_04835 [Actinobacteria bacterium]|nr:hypothetical protein [Actinomycetota bacterium]
MSNVPPSLAGFRSELEAAASRDLKRRSSRRRHLVMSGAITGGIAVIALAVLSVFNVFGANGPSIVDKAAAALAHQPNAILHVKTVGTQTNQDGTTVSWSDESWQSTVAPFARRQIEVAPDGPVNETALTGTGAVQLYDASSSTIYQSRDSAEYAAGSDVEGSRQEALQLLQSSLAKVGGTLTVDGRDAISIVSTDGHTTYIVDAKTNDPIEWKTTGTGGGTSLRFAIYEELSPTAANQALLDLAAQHPGATLDKDPAHYQEAMGRLFPKG